MNWGRIIVRAAKLWWGYDVGNWLNALIVHGPHFAGAIGLLDDVLILAAKSAVDLSLWESLNVSVFFEEVVKITVDGMEYEDMSHRDRERLKRRLHREHPGTVYIYGKITMGDVLRTAYSGYITEESGFIPSVFQVVSDLAEILPETAEEVAIVL